MVKMWKFHRGPHADKLALVLRQRLVETATKDVLMYDLWVGGRAIEFSESALLEIATPVEDTTN